jgi:predicted transcriptional regulator
MFEIGADELMILNLLIHAENAENIIQESGLPQKVGIDIIRQLFHYGYIQSLNSSNQRQNSFDVDGIKKTRFQLTAKGINEINASK